MKMVVLSDEEYFLLKQKENSYIQLRECYSQLEEDYRQLKEGSSPVNEDYSQLKECYSQLEEEYNRLKEDYSQLRKVYNQVNEALQCERTVHDENKKKLRKKMDLIHSFASGFTDAHVYNQVNEALQCERTVHDENKKKLRKKMDLIHSFASGFTDAGNNKASNKRRILQLTKNFEKCLMAFSLNQADNGFIVHKIQDISETCNNCMEHHKILLDEIDKLKDANLNLTFYRDQLIHQVANLKEKSQNIKKFKTKKESSTVNLLPLTPDSVCTEDSHSSSFSDQLSTYVTHKSVPLLKSPTSYSNISDIAKSVVTTNHAPSNAAMNILKVKEKSIQKQNHNHKEVKLTPVHGNLNVNNGNSVTEKTCLNAVKGGDLYVESNNELSSNQDTGNVFEHELLKCDINVAESSKFAVKSDDDLFKCNIMQENLSVSKCHVHNETNMLSDNKCIPNKVKEEILNKDLSISKNETNLLSVKKCISDKVKEEILNKDLSVSNNETNLLSIQEHAPSDKQVENLTTKSIDDLEINYFLYKNYKGKSIFSPDYNSYTTNDSRGNSPNSHDLDEIYKFMRIPELIEPFDDSLDISSNVEFNTLNDQLMFQDVDKKNWTVEHASMVCSTQDLQVPLQQNNTHNDKVDSNKFFNNIEVNYSNTVAIHLKQELQGDLKQSCLMNISDTTSNQPTSKYGLNNCLGIDYKNVKTNNQQHDKLVQDSTDLISIHNTSGNSLQEPENVSLVEEIENKFHLDLIINNTNKLMTTSENQSMELKKDSKENTNSEFNGAVNEYKCDAEPLLSDISNKGKLNIGNQPVRLHENTKGIAFTAYDGDVIEGTKTFESRKIKTENETKVVKECEFDAKLLKSSNKLNKSKLNNGNQSMQPIKTPNCTSPLKETPSFEKERACNTQSIGNSDNEAMVSVNYRSPSKSPKSPKSNKNNRKKPYEKHTPEKSSVSSYNPLRSPEGLKNYNLRRINRPNYNENVISKNVSKRYTGSSREEQGCILVAKPEKNESLPYSKSLSINIPTEHSTNCLKAVGGIDKLVSPFKLQGKQLENCNIKSSKLGVTSKLYHPSSSPKSGLPTQYLIDNQTEFVTVEDKKVEMNNVPSRLPQSNKSQNNVLLLKDHDKGLLVDSCNLVTNNPGVASKPLQSSSSPKSELLVQQSLVEIKTEFVSLEDNTVEIIDVPSRLYQSNNSESCLLLPKDHVQKAQVDNFNLKTNKPVVASKPLQSSSGPKSEFLAQQSLVEIKTEFVSLENNHTVEVSNVPSRRFQSNNSESILLLPNRPGVASKRLQSPSSPKNDLLEQQRLLENQTEFVSKEDKKVDINNVPSRLSQPNNSECKLLLPKDHVKEPLVDNFASRSKINRSEIASKRLQSPSSPTSELLAQQRLLENQTEFVSIEDKKVDINNVPSRLSQPNNSECKLLLPKDQVKEALVDKFGSKTNRPEVASKRLQSPSSPKSELIAQCLSENQTEFVSLEDKNVDINNVPSRRSQPNNSECKLLLPKDQVKEALVDNFASRSKINRSGVASKQMQSPSNPKSELLEQQCLLENQTESVSLEDKKVDINNVPSRLSQPNNSECKLLLPKDQVKEALVDKFGSKTNRPGVASKRLQSPSSPKSELIAQQRLLENQTESVSLEDKKMVINNVPTRRSQPNNSVSNILLPKDQVKEALVDNFVSRSKINRYGVASKRFQSPSSPKSELLVQHSLVENQTEFISPEDNNRVEITNVHLKLSQSNNSQSNLLLQKKQIIEYEVKEASSYQCNEINQNDNSSSYQQNNSTCSEITNKIMTYDICTNRSNKSDKETNSCTVFDNCQRKDLEFYSMLFDKKQIDLDESSINLENTTFNKDYIFDHVNGFFFGIISYKSDLVLNSYCKGIEYKHPCHVTENSSNNKDTDVYQSEIEQDKKFTEEECLLHKISKVKTLIPNQFKNCEQIGTSKAVKESPESHIFYEKLQKKPFIVIDGIKVEKKSLSTYSRLKNSKRDKPLFKYHPSSRTSQKRLVSSNISTCRSNIIGGSIQSLNIDKVKIPAKILQQGSAGLLVTPKRNSASFVTQSAPSNISNIDDRTKIAGSSLRKIQFQSSKPNICTILNNDEANDDKCATDKCTMTMIKNHARYDLTKDISSNKPRNHTPPVVRMLDFSTNACPIKNQDISELSMAPLENTVCKQINKRSSHGNSSSELLKEETHTPINLQLSPVCISTSKASSTNVKIYDLNTKSQDISESDPLTSPPLNVSLQNTCSSTLNNSIRPDMQVLPNKSKSQNCFNTKEEKFNYENSIFEESISDLSLPIQSQLQNKTSQQEHTIIDIEYGTDSLLKEESQLIKKGKPCDNNSSYLPVDHKACTVDVHDPEGSLTSSILMNDKQKQADISSEDEGSLVMDIEDCTTNNVAMADENSLKLTTSTSCISSKNTCYMPAGILISSSPKKLISSDRYIELPSTVKTTSTSAMYNIKVMTGDGFNHSKDIIPPSNNENQSLPCNSIEMSSTSLDLSDKVPESETSHYFPNFYTEYGISNKEVNSLEECVTEIVAEEPEKEVLRYCSYKQETLENLIPKGDKLPVSGNILQSVARIHSNNLDDYIRRNKSEQRNLIEFNFEGNTIKNISEVLKPFLSMGVDSLVELAKTTNLLVSYDSPSILKGLVIALNEIVEKECMDYGHSMNWTKFLDASPSNNLNSPSIDPRIQSFVVLFVTINDKKQKMPPEKSEFFKDGLHFMEQFFFCEMGKKLYNIGILPFLAYTYSCLARLVGSLLRVRQLLYDVLYCHTRACYSIAYSLLKLWPAVLRVCPLETYYNDPAAIAVIHALITKSSGVRFLNSIHDFYMMKLHQLFNQRYNYSAADFNANQLFEMYMHRLSQKDVDKAMILIAKRMGETWFLKYPFPQLMSIVKRWENRLVDDREGASAINILCCICRSLNPGTSQHATQHLFLLLKDLLTCKNTPSWMQELIAVNICRISRLNFDISTEILLSWKPSEISTEVVDQILINIVFRRSHKWWLSHKGGLKYLSRK